MRFCSQCGNQLNDAAQFCPKCGNQVTTVSNNQQPQPASQPQVQYVQAEPSRPIKPDSHMLLAILSTLFCCLPVGVYAIILASKVDGLYLMGEYEEAQMKADDAKKWSIIGMVCWAVALLLYLILVGVGIVGAAAASSSSY